MPPLLLSFGANGFQWALVCGGEAMALVVLGLILRRQSYLGLGTIGLTGIVLRQVVDAVNALPTWSILAIAGAVLLAVGTAWLAARESLRRIGEQLHNLWRALH